MVTGCEAFLAVGASGGGPLGVGVRLDEFGEEEALDRGFDSDFGVSVVVTEPF